MPINILLGAIAGITIFLGLPIARWRGASEKLRGVLALASAGVLLFLIIEVGYHAMESVEVSIKAEPIGTAFAKMLTMVVGLAVGLIGLAWIEEWRGRKHEAGAHAISIATMIAVGIGLHNFAEGLAIGQSFSGGAVALGTVLVAGFALHNATEGFGIAAPLAGQDVSWGRLSLLGLIGGGPTAVGAMLGGLWVNPFVELLFLSLAVGSLVYVTRELLRLRFATLGTVAAMTALAVGFVVGFGTELFASYTQSSSAATPNTSSSATLRFSGKQASPSSLTLRRGDSLTVDNGENVPLVFEGNGMYPGEIIVPAGGKVSVNATGVEGQYKVIDERGQSGAATVNLIAGAKAEPLENEIDAVGALTVLEGHVRASKDLHDRGASGQGPDPALDFKRAGKHAGHPQHELLEGSEPDALALQKLLKEKGVFDTLNSALSAYVAIAPNGKVSKDEIETKYQSALNATENARRAIAGSAYNDPSFRTRAAQFVMSTAASEYETATEGGRIMVDEPGVPGKDNYIEYQDARSFLLAARELLAPVYESTTPDAKALFDQLQTDIFASLDPRDADHPTSAAEVRTMIEKAEQGLVGATQLKTMPAMKH